MAYDFGGLSSRSLKSVGFGPVVKQDVMVRACDRGHCSPGGPQEAKEEEGRAPVFLQENALTSSSRLHPPRLSPHLSSTKDWTQSFRSSLLGLVHAVQYRVTL